MPRSCAADILKNDVFGPFHDIFPEKFQNKTNGVTPRRWLAFCNPPLRELITKTLGTERWINDTERLKVSIWPFVSSRWLYRRAWLIPCAECERCMTGVLPSFLALQHASLVSAPH